jgi:hypothetical protein
MSPGEEKAWENLRNGDPDEVCRRTGAAFDRASGFYLLKSFGKDISLSPQDKKIFGNTPEGDALVKKLAFFFDFSAVCYLNSARDIPLTGRLMKPVNMKEGQLFFRGSHLLPLDRVAEHYGSDRDGFLKRGEALCGEQVSYGDAALRLLPLPRVPVVVILWMADEEFPSRTDLLFDSSSELQLPIDVIWSIAMMSLIAFL